MSSPSGSARVSRREALARFAEEMHVETDSGYRIRLYHVIKSYSFESVVGTLILMNMCMTIYETDVTAYPNKSSPPAWLKAANMVMLVLYALEVALRLIVLQSHFFVGIINWDTFDLVLVIADSVLQTLQFLAGLDNVGLARALRIARSFRLVKAIRIWPAFRELYVMMHGLIGAFKAMLWAAVLMFLVLALFGIIAVEVMNPLVREIDSSGGYNDCERCHRAFASVWASMTTFFQQVVAGDSWGQVTIPVMERYPWTGPFFLLIVVTIQFGILNLILVSIVDQANKCSTEDAQFQAREKQEEYEAARVKLLEVCEAIDTDKSGEISLQELMEGYETLPDLANQLRFLDVKKDDMQILFNSLDPDSSGSVVYEEFVEQLFNMQNQDTGVLLSFIRSYVQDIRNRISEMQNSHTALTAELRGSSTDGAHEHPHVNRLRPHRELDQAMENCQQAVSIGRKDFATSATDSRLAARHDFDALIKCHLHALELLGQSIEYQPAEANALLPSKAILKVGGGAPGEGGCSADIHAAGECEVEYGSVRAVLRMDVGSVQNSFSGRSVNLADASASKGCNEATPHTTSGASLASRENRHNASGEVSSV
eukprot:TRINITY_DN46538_c0_g1_i1.p1 TRINITY_DN46538_c0_g1~~TRINITY_DN46538_c0_g1_i1.p1  ORF type:complete len:599 (-),score=67.44 TRINITY_DN46538_c0_g1_i1:434-2230(-)